MLVSLDSGLYKGEKEQKVEITVIMAGIGV